MRTVFILSDQHNPSFSGCYGGITRTPNLDQLAQEGTLFTSAYTPSPMCAPARACLFTGQFVNRIGFWDNTMPYDGSVRGFGHHLSEHGIPLTTIGKLDFAGEDYDYGIHEMLLPNNRKSLDAVSLFREPPLLRRPVYHVKNNWDVYPREDQTPKERDITNTAIQWLREHGQEENWVLNVNFTRPHSPWKALQEPLRRYQDEMSSIQLAPKYTQPLEELHEVDQYHSIYSCGYDYGIDRVKNSHAGYHAMIEETDESIGQILDTLKELSLYDDVLIVYSSDHGEMARAHGIWEKSAMYEDSIRIPLIIREPGRKEARICKAPVSLIDVFPTICDYAGLPPLSSSQGQSLRPFVNGEATAPSFRDYAFSESHTLGRVAASFAVQHDGWKLMEYVGYEPVLFHLDKDPDEMKNLAPLAVGNTEIAQQAARLRKLLSKICNPPDVDRQARAAQEKKKAELASTGQLEKELKKRGFQIKGGRLAPDGEPPV